MNACATEAWRSSQRGTAISVAGGVHWVRLPPKYNLRHPSSVVADLTHLAKFLRVDHVRILGGEPLLHPNLLSLISVIRDSGIAPKIRVVTNGVLLDRVPSAFWEEVDEVHISAYPKTTPILKTKLDVLRLRAKTFGAELTIKCYDSFRVSFRRLTGTHH